MNDNGQRDGLDKLDLVAIDMGYGHLRPADALSKFLHNQQVLLADQQPLSNEIEQRLWARARLVYEGLSKADKIPFLGPAFGGALQGLTSIPSLYPVRDLSRPDLAVRLLRDSAKRGLGLGLAARLQRQERTLLTTFFGPAVLADHHGSERIFCVVTDSDVHRVWAPVNPRHARVQYLAPTLRVRRRLRAYGVPQDKITVTGFPLPHELIGGPGAEVLRANLRRRLVRLDPRGVFLKECREEVGHFLGELPQQANEAPHLVFAVGGAGAQASMPNEFLPELAQSLRRKKLRLTLVAGLREEVADEFKRAIARHQLSEELAEGRIQILLESDHTSYFSAFNQLLAETDILWTKPSELSFFGALGIPLLFSKPVGSHERYNRRWAINNGSGIKEFDVRHAGQWLWEMLKDGTLAGAAWTGYMRMPKFGLYRIVESVLGQETLQLFLNGEVNEPFAS